MYARAIVQIGLPAMSGNRVANGSTYLLKVAHEPGVPVNSEAAFCQFKSLLTKTSEVLNQTCVLRPLDLKFFSQLRVLGLELRDSPIFFPELGWVVEGLHRKVFRRHSALDRVFVLGLQLIRSTKSIAVYGIDYPAVVPDVVSDLLDGAIVPLLPPPPLVVYQVNYDVVPGIAPLELLLQAAALHHHRHPVAHLQRPPLRLCLDHLLNR